MMQILKLFQCASFLKELCLKSDSPSETFSFDIPGLNSTQTDTRSHWQTISTFKHVKLFHVRTQSDAIIRRKRSGFYINYADGAARQAASNNLWRAGEVERSLTTHTWLISGFTAAGLEAEGRIQIL